MFRRRRYSAPVHEATAAATTATVTAIGAGLSTDERLRELEMSDRLHERQLQDHESVLKAIRESLDKLTTQVQQIQTRALIVVAVFFTSTSGGQAAIAQIFRLITS